MKPTLTITGSGWSRKDAAKFARCNKLISRGAPGSSSDRYRRENPDHVNRWDYSPDDIVGVSVNGNRPGALDVDDKLLFLAIEAKATIVTDTPKDRQRPYNSGERRVALMLTRWGYKEIEPGIWKP